MTRIAFAAFSTLVLAVAFLASWQEAGAGARTGASPATAAAQPLSADASAPAGATPLAPSVLPGTNPSDSTTGALRRLPLDPAAAIPRGPRLFERCTREAVFRRYRGAERRHFVRRCQLGYGRRLFRRRGVAAGH